MFWNKYLIPSFLLLAVVAALHWVASYDGLYWTIPWYDFMMHFLGGAWVALFLLWVTRTNLGLWLFSLKSSKRLVLGVFVVGVAWEIYELAFGFTSIGDRGYAFDTAHDLVMDVVGALAIVLIYRKSIGNK